MLASGKEKMNTRRSVQCRISSFLKRYKITSYSGGVKFFKTPHALGTLLKHVGLKNVLFLELSNKARFPSLLPLGRKLLTLIKFESHDGKLLSL